MKVKNLRLMGALLILPQVFRDTRGFFLETFRRSRYEELGLEMSFAQDNLSSSRYGTIRGMHFSVPGQAKLITVVKGCVFDAFVDVRLDSPTFGEWDYVYLDDEQKSQLFLPVGFAHGFCCVSEEALVLYKVSHEYNPATEKGFRFDDKEVEIEWPVVNPIVSDRDKEAPTFSELFQKNKNT